MSAKKAEIHPHEKRIQRYAFGALAATTLLSLQQVFAGDGELGAFELSLGALAGLALVGAVVGVVGVVRRSMLITAIAAALQVLALVPGGAPRPTVAAYAIGLLFGVALLLLVELVHMMERYERAHEAVDTENVPEEHVNRVTDEALRTLATRASFASLVVAGAIGVSYALAAWGPRQWRAATETSAPLGVAVVALALAGAVSLSILARGATFKFRRSPKPKELLPDVAE